MPYIALQLVGLQVVIGAMGVPSEGLAGDLPLIIAVVILAAFTYTSGLRAPAMIAVVKDTLIYITVTSKTKKKSARRVCRNIAFVDMIVGPFG
jgi:SSS family solute:Na+ symporter